MEPLHYPAVAIGTAELPPMATASADRQMCVAEGGLAADGDAEPQASEQAGLAGTSFDTLGEAYDFSNLYSWEKGFGIRYRKSILNAERTKCMQEIVCGCAGKAGVENSRSCRDCPALIRYLRSKAMVGT